MTTLKDRQDAARAAHDFYRLIYQGASEAMGPHPRPGSFRELPAGLVINLVDPRSGTFEIIDARSGFQHQRFTFGDHFVLYETTPSEGPNPRLHLADLDAAKDMFVSRQFFIQPDPQGYLAVFDMASQAWSTPVFEWATDGSITPALPSAPWRARAHHDDGAWGAPR